VLECTEDEISDINVLEKGLSNILFTFVVRGERYIFRYPGDSTAFFIYRKNECVAQRLGALSHADDTFVYIDEEGNKRYDFTFVNRRGYKTTVEGLSERFNKEYWNYAKLISGILRYRMPLTNVIKLVGSLQLENENINTWANGVARALKKYTNGEDDSMEDTNLKDDNHNAE
jgi:hypothetical protein